jgi:hypothetical protein
VEATPVEAGNPSLMTEPPSWFSPTLKGVLHIAANTNDPVVLKCLLLDMNYNLVVQLANVRDMHNHHHFIMYHLHNILGLDHVLMSKDVELYSELEEILEPPFNVD